MFFSRQNISKNNTFANNNNKESMSAVASEPVPANLLNICFVLRIIVCVARFIWCTTRFGRSPFWSQQIAHCHKTNQHHYGHHGLPLLAIIFPWTTTRPFDLVVVYRSMRCAREMGGIFPHALLPRRQRLNRAARECHQTCIVSSSGYYRRIIIITQMVPPK